MFSAIEERLLFCGYCSLVRNLFSVSQQLLSYEMLNNKTYFVSYPKELLVVLRFRLSYKVLVAFFFCSGIFTHNLFSATYIKTRYILLKIKSKRPHLIRLFIRNLKIKWHPFVHGWFGWSWNVFPQIHLWMYFCIVFKWNIFVLYLFMSDHLFPLQYLQVGNSLKMIFV